MLGFHDLQGQAEPCPRCGSASGDCGWVGRETRCSSACVVCRGTGAARCGQCGEVVPCGAEARRNPHPDARCAWEALAKLHARGCPWTITRGGVTEPLPANLRPV